MPLVTVMTATYNRADLLPRLYRSLGEQTFTDFEWVVVDDGSTDGTAELLASYERDAPFPVVAAAQPNAGKHVAFNRAARLASGTYVAGIDSDDWYLPHALERLVAGWREVEGRDDVGEVQGYTSDEDGNVFGDPYPAGLEETDYLEIVYRHRSLGDRIGMHRADLVKRFPFPEGVGNVMLEALVFNRMARAGFRVRLLHEVLAIKEYQPGGLTATEPYDLRRQAAMRYVFHHELAGDRGLPLGERYRTYANVVRHGIHTKRLRPGPRVGWWLLAAPAGAVLAARDVRRARR